MSTSDTVDMISYKKNRLLDMLESRVENLKPSRSDTLGWYHSNDSTSAKDRSSLNLQYLKKTAKN